MFIIIYLKFIILNFNIKYIIIKNSKLKILNCIIVLLEDFFLQIFHKTLQNSLKNMEKFH